MRRPHHQPPPRSQRCWHRQCPRRRRRRDRLRLSGPLLRRRQLQQEHSAHISSARAHCTNQRSGSGSGNSSGRTRLRQAAVLLAVAAARPALVAPQARLARAHNVMACAGRAGVARTHLRARHPALLLPLQWCPLPARRRLTQRQALPVL
jgi:hypothetical protein